MIYLLQLSVCYASYSVVSAFVVTLVYYSDVCDTNMHSFGMIQLSQAINHRLHSYVIISVPELHYTAYIS